MDRRLRSRMTWYGLGGYALVCLVFPQQVIRLGALALLAVYMVGLSAWGLLRQRDMPRRILAIELAVDLVLLGAMAAVFLLGR